MPEVLLLEREEKSDEPFIPNEAQRKVVSYVQTRFIKMETHRDKAQRHYDGRTLKEYINDNIDVYNGIVSDDIRATKEDWQSLIFDNKTRSKIKAIVALVVAGRPYLNILAQDDNSKEASDDAAKIRDMYDESFREELGSYKLYLQSLSCAVKATVIVEEYYEEIHKKQKDIKSIDHETGQVEYEEVDVIEGGQGSCKCRIVPRLTFYQNEYSAEVKHDCIVMEYLSKDRFELKYGKFPFAKYVKPGLKLDVLSDTEYKEIPLDTIDAVEVMKYFNEDKDEFILVANGIWINPQKNDSICPILYDHKKLPFAKMVFEYADEDVFDGKAMPDLMAGEQETINAILRMMIDQEILSIHKPILAGSGVELDSYQLFPGKIFSLSGDVNQVKEMALSGASQSSFQLVDFLQKRADANTSIDTLAQGVQTGGRKTAKEVSVLDDNARRMAGLFIKHIYKLLYDRAVLRISNIRQFYKVPVKEEMERDKDGNPIMDGDKPKMKKQYRKIMVKKPGRSPMRYEVKPGMFDRKYTVRMEEDVEIPLTRQQKLQVAQAILGEGRAGNSLIDADEATINWLIMLGENPDKFYIKKEDEVPMENNKGMIPELTPKPQTKPSLNI